MENYDLTGKTFGYWTVLKKDVPQHGKQNSRWICKCKCGCIKSVMRFTLINGRSQSCGCKPSQNRKGINKTHGMSKTRLYHEWVSMRRRCSNPNAKCAESYYEKGITVCDEWDKQFEPFRDWALDNGYTDDLTIDRIDNSKGYFPENCRWVPFDEQQRNKTNNVYVEYEGKMWCLRTLCTQLGFPYKLAHSRMSRASKKGKSLSTNELFAPIHTEKIAYKYRNHKSGG